MIPLKLELTNFLSYRQPAVLAFDHVDLACISGLNGAGKSSILDGMTWALFGRSRSKSDDDVVNRLAARDGQMAEVRLTFELEGSTYRIIRQKKPGRAAVLEFQQALGPEEWRSLTEGKLRETQEAIETLLRMNYDTFTNASFFLQGKADEFTTKTAGRRKEILAELLGVNEWDRYKEIITEQRKSEENRLALLDSRLADVEAELQQQTARQQALATAQAEYARLAEQKQVKEALLSQLRRLEAAIKQQQQQVKSLNQLLQRQQANLHQLRQTTEQRRQERAQFQALLADAASITTAHEAYQAADLAWQAWQEKANAHNRLQQARRPHELAIERSRSRLTQRQQELTRQAQQVAAMRQEQAQVTTALAAAQAQIATLTAEIAALAEREQAWHAARTMLQQLDSQRQLLQQQLAQAVQQAQRIAALEKEQVATGHNLAQAQQAVSDLTAQLAALGEQRQRVAVLEAEREARQAEQARIKDATTKLRDRLDRLAAEPAGACPLCGQPLSEAHRQTVMADLEADGKSQKQRFQENKARLETLAAEVAALQAAVKQAGRTEREHQSQQLRAASCEAALARIDQEVAQWQANDGPGRVAELQARVADDEALLDKQAEVAELSNAVRDKAVREKQLREQERQAATAEARLAEIARAVAQWETQGEPELADVARRLAAEELAPEAQTALLALDEEMAALGYVAAAHEAARAQRAELADAPGRYQALKQAEAAIKPLDDSLADLAAQIAAQAAQVAELDGQYQTAQAELALLQTDGGDLPAMEKEVTLLREQEIDASQRVGAAQQRLAVLDDLRDQQAAWQADRAQLTLRIQRLGKLERACGRDGVQALLIEQALPEIEADANELLDRLSAGTMRVVFDTQRQLKSSDRLRETLDIRIIDPAGERPYENFSGGEQFRVNFAIRLALSRILARRAGARLQTLVIDEGFGSQDPAGRQRLVEAINTIRGDFARILVITHIDELRDAFPVRIEVAKHPAGSVITVV